MIIEKQLSEIMNDITQIKSNEIKNGTENIQTDTNEYDNENNGASNRSNNIIQNQTPSKQNKTKTTITGVIYAPKKKQTCEATKTVLKEKLKKCNDMVNGLRNLNNGAVRIQCNNNETS